MKTTKDMWINMLIGLSVLQALNVHAGRHVGDDISVTVSNASIVEWSFSSDLAFIMKREAWVHGSNYCVREFSAPNEAGAIILQEIPRNIFDKKAPRMAQIRNDAGVFKHSSGGAGSQTNSWIKVVDAGDNSASYILPSLGLVPVFYEGSSSGQTGRMLTIITPFTNGASTLLVLDRVSKIAVNYERRSSAGTVYTRTIDEKVVIDTNIFTVSASDANQFPNAVVGKKGTTPAASYGGIGVLLKRRQGGGASIATVVTNTPAQRAGLMVDDAIVSIDQNDVAAYDASEVAHALRGSSTAVVKLVVMRGGTNIAVHIQREPISIYRNSDSMPDKR